MPAKTKSPDKTAAVLTVHRAPDMTKAGRKRIAKWLRSCADHLETYGDLSDNKFVARWCYAPRSIKSSKRP